MYRRFFKRIFDVLFALLAIPILIILLIIIGPIIYLQDKGTIFYNAPRLGKNGRVFIMYKLRSMKMNAPDLRNADGSTYNSKKDTRLTEVGKILRKTSLDEIPQLVNILKGDMSFIGPRPDLPQHRELYEGNEERKLEVIPGITGLSQAYYRNTVPWKERIQNDIYYVDHITLWLDIRIFLKTVLSIVKQENVFCLEEERFNQKRIIKTRIDLDN